MHPTASLVLAHERIADLTADAQRIRLARQALAPSGTPIARRPDCAASQPHRANPHRDGPLPANGRRELTSPGELAIRSGLTLQLLQAVGSGNERVGARQASRVVAIRRSLV